MQLFECQNCRQVIHFENNLCERCGHRLGYVAARQDFVALRQEDGAWHSLDGSGATWRFCGNAEHGACNWLVAEADPSPFCEACRHNRTIPDLSDPVNLDRWRRLEAAKRRLFYSLLQLGLPLAGRQEDPESLLFDMLADPSDPGAPKVLTGHDAGLITINISEADAGERESRREGMHEPYRTLLGHFRHEVGHFYWDLLVRDGGPGALDGFRALFGDEREDYSEALKRHYDVGAPADWQERLVSAYASSHPWEDWAETWAHYIHIVDTLDTAGAFGISLSPRRPRSSDLDAHVAFDAYRSPDFEALMEAWVPITVALNSLNRSMGLPDLYPFVIAPPVVTKLGFVHELVHSASAALRGQADWPSEDVRRRA